VKTSQTVSIVLIILCAALVINWVRGDEAWHIAEAIPFLGGYVPGFHDLAGIALIAYAAYRVGKMGSRNAECRSTSLFWEEGEDDDAA